MPFVVVEGAEIMCPMGLPGMAVLSPTPNGVTAGELPAATIMDYQSMVNIPTFGMCISLANPQVAAATSAALGVLTPQPCVPMTQTPWNPGAATTTIGEIPALTQASTCTCMWGGEITVVNPGQGIAQAT
jgi:Domain of unknown function (DUF4280)